MDDSRLIQFSPVFSETAKSYFLMELPEAVLTALKAGREVLLKGEGEEDAILCTESESFLLRSHETSNSVLVMDGNSIDFIGHQVIMTEKIVPPVHRLREILNENPFTWSETSPEHLYTWEDLLTHVQASASEIRAELHSMSAFEWSGFWRVLDDQERINTIKEVLSEMTKAHLGSISLSAVLKTFPRFSQIPLQKCLESAGEVVDGDWRPDPMRLYKMCAIDLFLSKGEFFEDEYRAAFRNLSDMLIPAKLNDSGIRLEDVLSGIAIKKSLKGRNYFKFFPAETLVKDFHQKLEQLFKTKERWSQEELRPYLKEVEEKELQKLLLKYTRRLVEDGVAYFTKKA